MIDDILQETEMITSLLTFIRSTDDANAVTVFNKKVDRAIGQLSNEKGMEDVVKFLKASKKFANAGIQDKYIDLDLLLADEWDDVIMRDYLLAPASEQVAIIPEEIKYVREGSKNWGRGSNYNSTNKVLDERFYITHLVTKIGESGTKYDCLTNIKPMSYKEGVDINCSAYGYLAYFPEYYKKDSKGNDRHCLLVPLTPIADSHFQGNRTLYDGIMMAEIRTFNRALYD